MRFDLEIDGEKKTTIVTPNDYDLIDSWIEVLDWQDVLESVIGRVLLRRRP